MHGSLCPCIVPAVREKFFNKPERPCNFTWEDLWWLHKMGNSLLWLDEAAAELSWACNRTSIVAAQEARGSDQNTRTLVKATWIKAGAGI